MSLTKVSFAMTQGNVVNVVDFLPPGYVTNGSVNYTTQIQAAIDSLKNTGGEVFFPVGTYQITSLVMNSSDWSNIRLRGEQIEATILTFTTTGTAITLGSNPGAIYNFEMVNMTVSSPSSNRCIDLVNGSICTFKRMLFINTGNSGANSCVFRMYACMQTVFDEIRLAGTNPADVSFGLYHDTDQTTFRNCYIKGGGQYSILLNGDAEGTGLDIHDSILGGGSIACVGIGINGNVYNVQIKNNYFEAVTGSAIQLGNAAGPYTAEEIEITGNYFYHVPGNGVYMRQTKNVLIQCNKFNATVLYDIDINSDITRCINSNIQLNVLSKEINQSSTQNKILYQDYYGQFHDRLTCVTRTTGDAWTPGAIANGSSVSKDITLSPVYPADFAIASFNLDIGGLTLTAHVKTDDTVTVVLANNTGSTVTLGAGVVYVRVYPR